MGLTVARSGPSGPRRRERPWTRAWSRSPSWSPPGPPPGRSPSRSPPRSSSWSPPRSSSRSPAPRRPRHRLLPRQDHRLQLLRHGFQHRMGRDVDGELHDVESHEPGGLSELQKCFHHDAFWEP